MLLLALCASKNYEVRRGMQEVFEKFERMPLEIDSTETETSNLYEFVGKSLCWDGRADWVDILEQVSWGGDNQLSSWPAVNAQLRLVRSFSFIATDTGNSKEPLDDDSTSQHKEQQPSTSTHNWQPPSLKKQSVAGG